MIEMIYEYQSEKNDEKKKELLEQIKQIINGGKYEQRTSCI